MTKTKLRIISLLSILLAISLAVVSYCGVFISKTYERDAPSMAAQGIGQDFVDLFLVVPMLIVSLIFVLKKSKTASFIFSGLLFYIVYSFIIYCFGVHFNYLFLLYCATLGLSFYIFIIMVYEFNRMDVQDWFGGTAPARLVGTYLIIVSLIFYLLWLKEIIPAILKDAVPASVGDYNLLTNPVHVIDLAFALPGLIITSVLLYRRHRLGFIFAPVALVFIIVLAIALAAMVMVLKMKGFSDDSSVAVIFIVLAALSLVFLFFFLKSRV
ncbi:MAG: hypothetical protein JSV24_08315 [Bacteroidales bacterium]|nr:MAG: hypothetical protein JSV24_08315 [Bacteroidales bacterium]